MRTIKSIENKCLNCSQCILYSSVSTVKWSFDNVNQVKTTTDSHFRSDNEWYLIIYSWLKFTRSLLKIMMLVYVKCYLIISSYC